MCSGLDDIRLQSRRLLPTQLLLSIISTVLVVELTLNVILCRLHASEEDVLGKKIGGKKKPKKQQQTVNGTESSGMQPTKEQASSNTARKRKSKKKNAGREEWCNSIGIYIMILLCLINDTSTWSSNNWSVSHQVSPTKHWYEASFCTIALTASYCINLVFSVDQVLRNLLINYCRRGHCNCMLAGKRNIYGDK